MSRARARAYAESVPVNFRGATVVKRRKEEDIVGVLEFEGKTSEDPEIVAWLAEHKARNGGKIRLSRGLTGFRIAFAKEADIAWWKSRKDRAARDRGT